MITIPIEARINEEIEYSKIIIKCADKVRDYNEIGLDFFSNLIQYVFYNKVEFKLVKNELKRLKKDG